MELFQCLLRQRADRPITRRQPGALRADLMRLDVVVGARQSGLSASLVMLIEFSTNHSDSPAFADSCADEKALWMSEGGSPREDWKDKKPPKSQNFNPVSQ